MSLQHSLDRVLVRHDELRDLLSSGTLASDAFMKASKEYAELTPVVEAVNALRACELQIAQCTAMMKDEADLDLRRMAEADWLAQKEQLPQLKLHVQRMLLPKDAADERNAILEIRAGAGGDEAALFAAELFDVYRLYAAKRGWKFETLELSDTGIGGFKEASAEVTGAGVFARLKFESGVHRVQRVPKTEASGRVHTSTVTVAVLPEAEEVDVKLDEKDLKIETMRSGGAGGQHVNKTESAVRMTHLPTGVTVHMQEEKSQIKNRAKALKIIRSRLYEMERQRLADERASARKDQVGTGDRSERIRTYNFPQSRVTDHRVNHTSHQIASVMAGDIDEFVDKLIEADEAARLAELGAAE
jgi:peptide chain release factor 1